MKKRIYRAAASQRLRNTVLGRVMLYVAFICRIVKRQQHAALRLYLCTRKDLNPERSNLTT